MSDAAWFLIAVVVAGIIGFMIRWHRQPKPKPKLLPPCELCGGTAFHKFECPEVMRRHQAQVRFPEDTDAPLAKRPPNIGGIGNPPYMGPNYVTEEQLAEEMKGLTHFYTGDPLGRRPNTLFPVRLEDEPFFEKDDES